MEQKEMEQLLDKVHDWIKSADQKISIALVLEAGVLALIASPTAKLVAATFPALQWGQSLLLFGVIVLFSYAMLKAVWALKPRLRMPEKMKSLLYFGSIAQMTSSAFAIKLKFQSDSSYQKDLTSQIHTSSQIASRKHRSLAESLLLLVIAVTCWLIVIAWLGYGILTR